MAPHVLVTITLIVASSFVNSLPITMEESKQGVTTLPSFPPETATQTSSATLTTQSTQSTGETRYAASMSDKKSDNHHFYSS